MRLSSKRKGTFICYYWGTNKYGKKYRLNGKTMRARLQGILRHIKREAHIPLQDLHIGEFLNGYAIFNNEGERMVYLGARRNGWNREPAVVTIEKMDEVQQYDS
jgi:hypothetical protein